MILNLCNKKKRAAVVECTLYRGERILAIKTIILQKNAKWLFGIIEIVESFWKTVMCYILAMLCWTAAATPHIGIHFKAEVNIRNDAHT